MLNMAHFVERNAMTDMADVDEMRGWRDRGLDDEHRSCALRRRKDERAPTGNSVRPRHAYSARPMDANRLRRILSRTPSSSLPQEQAVDDTRVCMRALVTSNGNS